MPGAIWPLTKVQYGLETIAAPGTLVAAVRRLPFESGAYTPTIERTPLDEAYGILVQRDDLDVRRGSALTLTTYLDTENSLLPLLCGLGNVAGAPGATVRLIGGRGAGAEASVQTIAAATGAITAIQVDNGGAGYGAGMLPAVEISGGSGAGATATATVAGGSVTAIVITAGGAGYDIADYDWLFEPSMIESEDLRSGTFEFEVTDGRSSRYLRRFGYGTVSEFSIDIPRNGPAMLSSTWFGRAEQAAPAAGLSAATQIARKLLRANDFAVFLDDSWASLGMTRAIGEMRQAQLAITTGATPSETLEGRDDSDMNGLYRGRLMGTITLTADFHSSAAAEIDHWRSGDLRFARVQSKANRLLGFDVAMRMVETPQQLQHDGDQMTVSLAGMMRYDPVSARALRMRMVNNLGNL